MARRIHSFVWSGLVGVICLVIGIVTAVKMKDPINLAIWGGLAVTSFTLISCLILNNNFLGEMMMEIFSWGFVRMPGLIFSLDLDGIIWFLTVKMLFAVIGIALALLSAGLAIALGLLVSIFVYPYALCKNIKTTNEANATKE